MNRDSEPFILHDSYNFAIMKIHVYYKIVP